MTFWLLKVMFIKSCAQCLYFTYYGTEEVLAYTEGISQIDEEKDLEKEKTLKATF